MSFPISTTAGTRVGFLTGGLSTYWSQFPDMLPRVQQSSTYIKERIALGGAEIVDAGVVSDDFDGARAADLLRQAAPDLVVLFVATYMTSGQVVAIAREVKVPILLLELQPEPHMPHAEVDTGDFLLYAGVAALPELSNVFERCGARYDIIVGHLQSKEAWKRIETWVRAATVVTALRRSRYGMIGSLYPGMLDIATNMTSVIRSFGGNTVVLELDELRRLLDEVDEHQAAGVIDRVRSMLRFADDIDEAHLGDQARVAVAMQQLVERHSLDTLAWWHFGQPGTVDEMIAGAMGIGGSLLITDGVPVGTEYDVRATIAMLILNKLGTSTMFTEQYSTNYADGVVELGHDGATNLVMTDGSAQLRPLSVFHGKSGGGNSITSTCRPGPVTLLAVAELGDGSVRLVVGEGDVVPGPLMDIGNTVSRVRFDGPPERWLEAWSKSGSGHHFAMGAGHLAAEVRVLAELLGIECRVVEAA